MFRKQDGGLETTDGGVLRNVHPESVDCYKFGCVMHSPSATHMVDWPLNWREDRGIMERICEHGTGHPDLDSADWLTRLGQGFQNIHGCCGCCREEN